MDNAIMMRNAAIRVCVLLEKYGITATISNWNPEPTAECLRDSWYVDRAKQYGVTDLIHIKLSCGGFIAVTDKCEIMSGANFMINDAFTTIDTELVMTDGFYLTDFGFKCWCDDFGEDAFVVGNMHTFETFLHRYDGVEILVDCCEPF